MRQDEVRTTEHHHTPSIKARQPGRRKSNQIPRGRDQHRNWARTPQGTNHRGEGGNKRRGEPTTAKKRTNAKKPHHTKRGTQRPKKRHPQKRRQKHQHNKNTTKRSQTREETKHETKDKPTARKARPKPRTRKQTTKQRKGGQEGNWTPRRPQKDPHHTVASGSKSLRGAQGQRAQETKMVEMRITKPWGEKKKGEGSLRHTPCSIFKVVLFICSESVRPAVPDCKGDRIKPLLPCSRSSLHFA